MILHHTKKEVTRYNWFKWIVLLVLLIILIIMLLTGRAFDKTATSTALSAGVSDTGAAETTAQVDQAAPMLAAPTFDTPGSDLTSGEVALSGTGKPGSDVQVVINGEIVGTAKVGADGKWSLTTELPAGEYQLGARTLDADGQVAAEAETMSLTISEALVAPTINLPDEELAAGLSALSMPSINWPDFDFSAGQFSLTGTGRAGDTVEVVVDGAVVGTTTVGDDGLWSFDFDLPEGEYEVATRTLDALGNAVNTSESAMIGVAAAEVLEIREPADGATLQSGELVLSGIGTPGAEIEILDNGVVIGTAVVSDDGSWSFALEPEPGNHEYGVRGVGDESVAGSVMTTVEAPVTETSTVGVCANPKPGIDQGATYVVGECEWLIRIANRLEIEYDSLISVNPQIKNPNIIYPGQIINLPPR